MGLFSNFVSASNHEGAGLGEAFDTIRELFAFLPELVTLEKLIEGTDEVAKFWARFLVWILLFATIYFGAGFVFKDNKRVAVVVSIVISLMGTLLIPYSILVNIFQTYGLVAGIIVWTIPLAAGMFIAHKVQQPFLRALIYGIAAWILFSINETIVKVQGFANTSFPFFGLLLAVVIILFFWNLGAMFGIQGGGGIGSEGATRSLWNRLTGGNYREPEVRTPSVTTSPDGTSEERTRVIAEEVAEEAAEEHVDRAEIAEEKKLFKEQKDFLKYLVDMDKYNLKPAASELPSRGTFKRWVNSTLASMRAGIKKLEELQFKEIKLEHLRERWLKKYAVWSRRNEIAELLDKDTDKEIKVLRHLEVIYRKLFDFAKNLEEGGEMVDKKPVQEAKNYINLARGLTGLLIEVNVDEIRKLNK